MIPEVIDPELRASVFYRCYGFAGFRKGFEQLLKCRIAGDEHGIGTRGF